MPVQDPIVRALNIVTNTAREMEHFTGKQSSIRTPLDIEEDLKNPDSFAYKQMMHITAEIVASIQIAEIIRDLLIQQFLEGKQAKELALLEEYASNQGFEIIPQESQVTLATPAKTYRDLFAMGDDGNKIMAIKAVHEAQKQTELKYLGNFCRTPEQEGIMTDCVQQRHVQRSKHLDYLQTELISAKDERIKAIVREHLNHAFERAASAAENVTKTDLTKVLDTHLREDPIERAKDLEIIANGLVSSEGAALQADSKNLKKEINVVESPFEARMMANNKKMGEEVKGKVDKMLRQLDKAFGKAMDITDPIAEQIMLTEQKGRLTVKQQKLKDQITRKEQEKEPLTPEEQQIKEQIRLKELEGRLSPEQQKNKDQITHEVTLMNTALDALTEVNKKVEEVLQSQIERRDGETVIPSTPANIVNDQLMDLKKTADQLVEEHLKILSDSSMQFIKLNGTQDYKEQVQAKMGELQTSTVEPEEPVEYLMETVELERMPRGIKDEIIQVAEYLESAEWRVDVESSHLNTVSQKLSALSNVLDNPALSDQLVKEIAEEFEKVGTEIHDAAVMDDIYKQLSSISILKEKLEPPRANTPGLR